jgi:hypothetical protein
MGDVLGRSERLAGPAAGEVKGDPSMATKRVWTETVGDESGEALCQAGTRDLTLAELRARALRPLTGMIAAMCDWGAQGENGRVGDVRFLILEFAASPERLFYVQILTEPGDPVLTEAVSGASTPAVRAFMTRPRRRALAASGFRVGGSARNFQKTVHVSNDASARRLADQLLCVLYEVYDYRGRQALMVHRHSDARYESGAVFTTVTIDDVRRMTTDAGLVARRPDPAASKAGRDRRDAARLLIVDEPFGFVIELCDPSDQCRGHYRGVSLVTGFGGTAHLADRDILEMSGKVPFAHLSRDADGDILVRSETILAGATPGHYREYLTMWLSIWSKMADLIKPHRRRRKGRPASEPLESDDSGFEVCADMELAERSAKRWVH